MIGFANVAVVGVLLLSLLPAARPAEHLGVSLDGKRYDAKVFPPGVAKAVYAQVEFKGRTVLLFRSERSHPALTLRLPTEEIDDIHAFDAQDPVTKEYWKINVEDVDP